MCTNVAQWIDSIELCIIIKKCWLNISSRIRVFPRLKDLKCIGFGIKKKTFLFSKYFYSLKQRFYKCHLCTRALECIGIANDRMETKGRGIIINWVYVLLRRARWRDNRTIFNTPNARLMNVSLLRENKLLHGQGDRRGSRASVRGPSRQPSMVSLCAHLPNASQGAKHSHNQRVSRTGFYPFKLLSKQL